jgi:hypothetical protein
MRLNRRSHLPVGTLVVGAGSGVRALFRLSAANLADLAMRGLANSFLTLAGIPLPERFFVFFRHMHGS